MRRSVQFLYVAMVTVLFATCSLAVASAVESVRAVQRKTLDAVQKGIFGVMMVELQEADRGLAHGADRIIAVKIQEFQHLVDLEELRDVAREPLARKLLTDKLSNQRYGMKSGCVIDINSLEVFVKMAKDARLHRQLNDSVSEIRALCKSVDDK